LVRINSRGEIILHKEDKGGMEMRHKKLVLILSSFILAFLYIINPYFEKRATNSEGFKDEIIRFHVRANSDMEEDQALKLKVRDKILEEMGDELEHSKSIGETRNIITDNLHNIKDISEEVIAKEGKDYSVDVFLGKDYFPTRKYGNITFPSGEYETLLVTIGEGAGQNWWCVMFPPLCFVDITHSVSYNLEKDLSEVLTEEEIDLLLSNKEPPLILKSKLAEVYEKTKTYFAKLSMEKIK
jgi:stage II sporulation protein R